MVPVTKIGGFLLALGAAASMAGAGSPVSPRATPAAAPGPPCAMPEAERAWTQRALQGWERASRDFLGLTPTPLPWIMLVDGSCAWHLAPAPDAAAHPEEARSLEGAVPVDLGLVFASAPVTALAVPHRGSVRLPDGTEIPAEPMAATRLRREQTETFFVMSALPVWLRHETELTPEDLADFMLGVLSHEIVHTRQLVSVVRALEEIDRRTGLPKKLNDDVLETHLSGKRRYVRAYGAERDLLFQAAAEDDRTRRRELAARALAMADARRARWLRGRRAPLAEVEPLFLAMEGVAEWCRYRLLLGDGATRSPAEAIELVRGKENNWSQDEGLALFLVLDRELPGWQRRMFEGTPPSPFALLAEALRQPA